jgi:ribose transport system substrate-binding protein
MADEAEGRADETLNDEELDRRDRLAFYARRGLSRRETIRQLGIGAVLSTGVVSALAACSGSSSSSASAATAAAASAAAGGRPIKYLDVGFGDVIAWCDQIRDSTKFWGSFFNIEVTHVDGGASPATQLQRFQDAAASEHWDICAVCPVASNSLVSVAQSLIDKGTAVIQQAVDIGKPGEDIGQLTFISQDYVDVGKTLATYLFERIGGKGTAIVTQGVAGTGNVIGRHEGVHEALQQFPDVQLLAEDYTDYSDEQSRQLWDAYVQKYPRIDCAVTLTTGSAALNGTYAALAAAGRASKTLIGANNAEDFACQAVIDGKLAATIRHSSNLLGMWAAVVGAQHMTGVMPTVPKICWMPDQLVFDTSTAQSMIDLQKNELFLV